MHACTHTVIEISKTKIRDIKTKRTRQKSKRMDSIFANTIGELRHKFGLKTF